MHDEVEFYKALKLSNSFYNLGINFILRHPNLPKQFIEVDNISQKNKTIFIFEGKSSRETSAIIQLKERYTSLKIFKNYYKKSGTFDDYDFIRLFYYSIKKRIISEFNFKGVKVSSNKFNNLNELALILRNL